MSVAANEIEAGVRVLRDLGARRIFLFGSALSDPESARDIDFGCEGLPAERYFRAVGELIAALGRDVDLIDLSSDTPRTWFIRRHAKVLYES